MKHILFLILLFVTLRSVAQVATQVQAKRGVFTEQLFLKDRWINHFSTNLSSEDSTSDNVPVTAGAVSSAVGKVIHNQQVTAQPASFFIQGRGVIGSENGFRNSLFANYPAQLSVTQNNAQYGLSIQRSARDKAPADAVFVKTLGPDFSTSLPLQTGDPVGSIYFSGIAGNNTTLATPMSLYGYVETSTPAFLSSGFIFNTTDANGAEARRMGIIPNGSLMIGNATTNNYKLNVVNGDVRFNSLSANGDVLVGSDNNGVVSSVIPISNLYLEDNFLKVMAEPVIKRYTNYTAVLTQSGAGNPQAHVLENELGEQIVWTRDSPGHYTGTLIQGIYPGSTWLHSYASDALGQLVNTRLYRSSNSNSIKLVVKDENFESKDGWQISVEIRLFFLG